MKHEREALEAEFRLVDENLPGPVSVHLIGGGAMSLQDLKVATKDIDVVLESEEALAVLKEPRTPEQVVEALQAHEDEDVQAPVLAAIERLVMRDRLLREGRHVRRNPEWAPE